MPPLVAGDGTPFEKIRCSVENCTQKFIGKKEITKHLKEHMEDGMTITCFYSNCKKKNHIWSSFSSHLSKYHKNTGIPISHPINIPQLHSSDSIVITNDNLINEPLLLPENQEGISHNSHNDKILSEDNFLINLAHFYLKLEFKFCIPASTVQYIASEISDTIMHQNTKVLKQNISQHLEKLGVQETTIEDIFKNTLDKVKYDRSTRDNLQTNNFLRKFSGDSLDPLNHKKGFFHYVPLKATLTQLFNNKSLGYKLTFVLPENNSGVFKDFTDGSVFKNNTYLKRIPTHSN